MVAGEKVDKMEVREGNGKGDLEGENTFYNMEDNQAELLCAPFCKCLRS